MEAFIYSAVGIILGGLITFLVSRYYYQRASEELRTEANALREETEKLRRHTTLILRGLEEGGIVKFNRNDQGEIIGIEINLSGVVSAEGSASGNLMAGEDSPE